MEYGTVILGGTFDRFHVGHEVFLDKAFQYSNRVVIGLTTQKMLQKIVSQDSIWPYEKRKKAIEEFAEKYCKDFDIFPIEDKYGPSTDMENLDAIFATEETKKTCQRINQVRKKNGLKPLKIITVPFVYAEDCRKISSSRIRDEEIDRNGRILVDYSITGKLREDLKTPRSKLFEGDNSTATKDLISYIHDESIGSIICVGDQVSYDFLESGFKPRNIIIDGKIERKQTNNSEKMMRKYKHRFSLVNPSGIISKESWSILKSALEKYSAVMVDGEEDLLVFPLALLSKNNTGIVYGQPGRGKVIVRVDEYKKEEVRKLLSGFSTIPR